MKIIQFSKINRALGILVLLVSFLSISCADDVLDKKPVTEVTPETLDSEDRVVETLNASYSGLQGWPFPQMFQSVRSDDLHSQQANFWGGGAKLDQFLTITSTNGDVAALWRKFYTIIGRANFSMELAQEFDGFVTSGLRERIIAEAKFLRGFGYFQLVRYFGDVPLFVDAIRTIDDPLYIERSPVATVYAQIVQDFTDAAAGLPKVGESDQWRATSGAALAYLAKVHLYLGNYKETVDACEEVMTHGYQLEEVYADNFSLENEFGKESIFEVNYVTSPGEGSQSFQWMMFSAGGKFTGWGNMLPRQSLVDIFDDSDQRKQATFVLPGSILNSPGLAEFGWEPAKADFGYSVGVNAVSKKFFLTYEELDVLSSSFNSPKNEKIMRYSEVYLMHAEASLMGGGGNGADSFQKVIDRAYGIGSTVAPAYDLAGVKEERRREFATEGWNRFSDLVRWGDIQAAMDAVGKTDLNISRDLLLPIPDSEIQLSDGLLTQNPNYNN